MGEVVPMIKPAQRRVIERAIDGALRGPRADRNERILQRTLGIPATPATPETDADPSNPTAKLQD